jgi:hypothetical protein
MGHLSDPAHKPDGRFSVSIGGRLCGAPGFILGDTQVHTGEPSARFRSMKSSENALLHPTRLVCIGKIRHR